MTLNPHPSLKRLAEECSEWLENAHKKDHMERYTSAVQNFLSMPGKLDQKAGLQLRSLALFYDVASCDAFLRSDIQELTRLVQHAVHLRSLIFRWDGMYSDMRQDLGNWPTEFSDGMKAAGPCMLSWWDQAGTCAQLFIEMAEKDQAINTTPGMRRIKHGTSDAYLLSIFSAEFKIPTIFVPPSVLVPQYQAVLDAWNTDDEAQFQAAMRTAAELHISRSKDNTDKIRFEFDATIDRVFPAELLAIQALRRRYKLPEFDADHALIDEPWKVLRNIKSIESNELAKAVEDRLIEDYPKFR